MKRVAHAFLIPLIFAFVTVTAPADTIISEKFSGNAETDLVGTPTPDENNWTGGTGEIPEQEEPEGGTTKLDASDDDAESTDVSRFSIKQDGTTGGIPFTAYHKFTLKQGLTYTLEAVLSPTNRADNQWFTAGFAVTARDGDAAPNIDGATTYGQTVLSGSGYRYGWIGPDTKDMCELKGPGLHLGPVKVVLDTSDPKDYMIELFDGEGDSIHGPKPIGTPAITQVFIGSSGTDGSFDRLTLSESIPAKGGEVAPPHAIKSSTTPPILVMLGDSTTDQGMPTVVKKKFDEMIEPLLERPSVINAGKGGDNATSALDRLDADVLAHNPDIVTVSFGLNDTGGRKPEQYEESLRTIVKTLKSNGIEVVLMTGTPFNNERHGWGEKFEELGGLDEYMDKEFCERMRSVAASEDVLLCDLHAIFMGEIEKDPDLINTVISGDGVHLTAEGYDLVTKHIAPILHSLLSEK